MPRPASRKETSVALTGADVNCTEGSGGVALVAGTTKIGEVLETDEQCEALAATRRGDVVCGWTGHAFSLHSLKTGERLVDNGAIGAKFVRDCAKTAETWTTGVVCAWVGDGYRPLRVGAEVVPMGDSDHSALVDDCKRRVAQAAEGHVCGWHNEEIRLFDARTGQVDPSLGLYAGFESCNAATEKVGRMSTTDLEALRPLHAPGSEAKEVPATDGLALAGGGYPYGDCEDAAFNNHIVKTDGSGELKCKPDTLYSWGPAAKIDWFGNAGWTGRLARGGSNQPLFATPSPFATFGYGLYAMRIRLNDGVQFRLFKEPKLADPRTYCDRLSAPQVDNTVVVRWWKSDTLNGLDYILCGKGPIHSFSWGTREQIAEMDRDAAWVATHQHKEYELYVKAGERDVIYPDHLDGHGFTPEIFDRNRSFNITGGYMQLPEEKLLFFNPNSASQNARFHFSTALPSYFNRNNAGGLAKATESAAVPATGISLRDFVGSSWDEIDGTRHLSFQSNKILDFFSDGDKDPSPGTWGYFDSPARIYTKVEVAAWLHVVNRNKICKAGTDRYTGVISGACYQRRGSK